MISAGAVLSGAEAWSSANPARYGKTAFDKAVWHETLAGKELPYTVEYCKGAKGSVKVLPKAGRDGKNALQVIKSNNDGYIVIRFKKEIPVKKGDKFQFNAFYQGKKASPQYSLAMLRIQLPGKNDFKLYTFHAGITGGPRMQEVICTPDNTWERKFSQRKAEAGMTAFEPVMVFAGAASETIWSDFYVEDDNISAENWNNNLNRRPPVDKSGEMISMEEMWKNVKADTDHTAKVVKIDGKARLLLDGKVVAPVINGPYGKFAAGKTYSNVKSFGEAGIHLVKMGLRLGQGKEAHIYPGTWTGKDELNIKGAVEQVTNTLRLDPKARIILSITLHPYWQFTQDFPEEAWIGEGGFPLYGNGIHLLESQKKNVTSPRYFIWPSYQSEKLQKLYKEQLKKIVDELKRTGLTKSIVGVHIGGGHDNQMTVTHFDYSQPSIRAFRRYLKEEYKTIEALQTAWGDESVTFENAGAPKSYGNNDCLDPVDDRQRIDFYRYNKVASWRVAGEMADYVRKLMGKDIFTMRWCMGAYADSLASSLDMDDFVRNQKFDILVAQAAYNRRPPASACSPRVPLDSFHKHGKLYVNEFDTRTWNAAPSWEKEIMSITWGLMIDPQMWDAANRKLCGSMFANDMGYWYLDMAPGWFDHPAIMKNIKETTEVGNMLAAEKPSGWHPDVAFVVDNDGFFLRNIPSPKWMFDVGSLVGDQGNLLGLASVPYNFYSLRDFMEDPKLAKEYKVIVFAGMFHIDGARRKFLNSLKNGNRTLVFLSGTGRLSRNNGAGIIEVVRNAKRNVNHFVKAEPGVKENMLSYWMVRTSVHLNCKPQWYESIPLVYAKTKPGDKILARFAANNEPAVVERQMKGWKSIYIGESGGLTPEYLNRIAKEAGAYRLTEAGFQCESNGNFMSVHAMKSGKTVFNFPFKADITNLCSGKVYKNTDKIPVNAEAGATYWFTMKKTR